MTKTSSVSHIFELHGKSNQEKISKISLNSREILKFQKLEWKIQERCYIIMCIFVISAFLGAWGRGGVFHDARATSQSGDLMVHYDRFVRSNSDHKFEITVKNLAKSENEIGIWLNNKFLKDLRIENIHPAPSRVEFSGDGETFIFQKGENTDSFKVYFYVKPQETIGARHAEIMLFNPNQLKDVIASKESVHFRQIIYP